MKQLFTEKLHRTTRRHILHKCAYFSVPRYCTAQYTVYVISVTRLELRTQ